MIGPRRGLDVAVRENRVSMNKVERSEAHTDREGRTLNSLIAVVVVFSACALAAPAQTLPTYTIYRTYSPIAIDGKMTDRAWRNAPVATDFHFNWWTAGEKEPTDVRMLWDDQFLYVAYYCHDKHIYADVTEHQGPVSNDDAIEFYASPNPNKLDFDGFEINALGTWLAFRIILREGRGALGTSGAANSHVFLRTAVERIFT